MLPLTGSVVLRVGVSRLSGPNPACLTRPLQIRGMVRYDEFLEMEKWQHTPQKLQFAKSEGAAQKDKGKIYSKYPFKYTIEKGKKYSWCSCGFSHVQPFCDGAHKKPWVLSGLKPVKFIAEETKEVWFCNCKQTNTKPYCDKSCEAQEVRDARV